MPVCACVAVITAVPAPTIETDPVVPTVATLVLLDEYVKTPLLVEIGGVRVNAASP